jgi:hypothetical protein
MTGQLSFPEHGEGIDLVLRIPGSGQQFYHAQANLLDAPTRILTPISEQLPSLLT